MPQIGFALARGFGNGGGVCLTFTPHTEVRGYFSRASLRDYWRARLSFLVFCRAGLSSRQLIIHSYEANVVLKLVG